MNTKPYAVVKSGQVVRRFASVQAAANCADRIGGVFAFIYADGSVRENGVVLAKVA